MGVRGDGCCHPVEQCFKHLFLVTLEGVPDSERQAFADAFAACGGLQCGFCIPGFIVAGAALLDELHDPTLDDIRLGLSGNLCRCTGYYPIMQAVQRASVVDVELAP